MPKKLAYISHENSKPYFLQKLRNLSRKRKKGKGKNRRWVIQGLVYALNIGDGMSIRTSSHNDRDNRYIQPQTETDTSESDASLFYVFLHPYLKLS